MAEMLKKTSSWEEVKGESARSHPVPPAPPSRPLPLRTSSVPPKAQSAGVAVGDLGAEIVSSAEQLMSAGVDKQSRQGAKDLAELADALRRTSLEIEGNAAAPYVDKAAEQMDRVAQLLLRTDARAAVRGVEGFARREPLVFLGGAFVAGLLGARFLRSSSTAAPKSANAVPPDGAFVELKGSSPGTTRNTRPGPLAP